MIILVMAFCLSFSFVSGFQAKVSFELSDLGSIGELDNSDGSSIYITIHDGGSVVAERYAVKGVYLANSTIIMQGDKFNLDYETEYTYNLSTIHGNFYYDFTTPGDPTSPEYVSEGLEMDLDADKMHTGQTASYGTGDDADNDGISKSFTDNGDGTVTDGHTGLVWTKAVQGNMAWTDALDNCSGLNLAGHSDWRLPNRQEAFTMIDYSRTDYSDPAFDWTDGYYWTSTTRPDTQTDAYAIRQNGNGRMYGEGKTESYYVRCVRG